MVCTDVMPGLVKISRKELIFHFQINRSSRPVLTLESAHSLGPYLARWYQYTSQGIKRYQWLLTSMFLKSGLQIKHGERGTHEIWEVVKKHEAISKSSQEDWLQMVILHGDFPGKATGIGGFGGGPSDRVSRATCHTVCLLTLRRRGIVKQGYQNKNWQNHRHKGNKKF